MSHHHPSPYQPTKTAHLVITEKIIPGPSHPIVVNVHERRCYSSIPCNPTKATPASKNTDFCAFRHQNTTVACGTLRRRRSSRSRSRYGNISYALTIKRVLCSVYTRADYDSSMVSTRHYITDLSTSVTTDQESSHLHAHTQDYCEQIALFLKYETTHSSAHLPPVQQQKNHAKKGAKSCFAILPINLLFFQIPKKS